jgi:N-acetyl-1-D-myo-inositol-2-amino-2-deoxy-alpha-D-glucopyranoside deacetylase
VSGLLVIGAHPDDEVLLAGGTLAACAAAGLQAGVVSLTRGELGPIADAALATRETLGEVRLQELRASCEELGASLLKCWRRPDGSLRWTDRSGIVRQLVALFETNRPNAVITFGEDGLYYHPDHIATYEFVRTAVDRMPKPPALYRAVWPKSAMHALALELRENGLPDYLWDLVPEDFGTEDTEGSFALDVRGFVPQKLAALRAHRTQVPRDHAFAALDQQLAEKFLGTEWFAPVSGSSRWLSEVLGND